MKKTIVSVLVIAAIVLAIFSVSAYADENICEKRITITVKTSSDTPYIKYNIRKKVCSSFAGTVTGAHVRFIPMETSILNKIAAAKGVEVASVGGKGLEKNEISVLKVEAFSHQETNKAVLAVIQEYFNVSDENFVVTIVGENLPN